MRVFVSSTVFDLVDIRSELYRLLSDLSVSPILSDHKTSEFNLVFDANSIETCLLNVEGSDAVVVVLDQRYGPRLGKCGFDDVSATHLEYRHAKKHRKPIYFYVRDRLEADFKTFEKNPTATDLKLPWVNPKDYGLFDLLAEHRALDATSHDSNWFSLFTNSLDLKECVRRHFEPVVKPQVLLDAIQQNRFPIFSYNLDASRITVSNIASLKCTVTFTNVGLAPAFDFTFHWQNNEHKTETKSLVANGQEVTTTALSNLMFGPDVEQIIKVQYDSTIGVTVREQYKVYCMVQGGHSPGMFSGITLIDRTYHNGPIPSLTIQ